MDDYKKALIDAIDVKIKETSTLLLDPELEKMAEEELKELNQQKDQILGNFNDKDTNEKNEDSLDGRDIIFQVSKKYMHKPNPSILILKNKYATMVLI